MAFTCPNCGSPSTKEIALCPACGYNLQPDFIETNTCLQCKRNYPAGANFCIDDGAKLFRPGESVSRCTTCKRYYANDTKFCTLDGGEVSVVMPDELHGLGVLQQPGNFLFSQTYPKASLENRFLATLLDGLISAAFSIPAILLFRAALVKSRSYFDRDGATTLFVFSALCYLLPVTYNFIKDGLGQGQSWGKRSLDLMVVDLDSNTPCSKEKSFLRNLIWSLVAVIPFIGWLIEPVMVLAAGDGKRLGDKGANTQVIEKKYYY